MCRRISNQQPFRSVCPKPPSFRQRQTSNQPSYWRKPHRSWTLDRPCRSATFRPCRTSPTSVPIRPSSWVLRVRSDHHIPPFILYNYSSNFHNGTLQRIDTTLRYSLLWYYFHEIDFYPRRSEEILRSAAATPKHSYADRSLVEGLESQASRIREVLTANQMRIEVLVILSRDWDARKNWGVMWKKPMRNCTSFMLRIRLKLGWSRKVFRRIWTI